MTVKIADRKTDYAELFTKTLLKLSHHKRAYEVLADFVRIAADDLDMAVMKNAHQQPYRLEIKRRYTTDELQLFPELFRILCLGLESAYDDFLGQTLMKLDMGNHCMGQHFSPGCVGRVLRELLWSSDYAEIHKYGFMQITEAACGSGGLVIAAAERMKNNGYNPSTQVFASCTEIDPTVADMAFVQLSLLGIAAEVFTGNTLTQKNTRLRRTAAYYLHDFDNKLRFRRFHDAILPLIH